jgi:intein-encoded DNA endonuclease-like protein
MSPPQKTTTIPRRDELPDHAMPSAQTNVRVQKYLPFEIRARLCARVLKLAKLSISYQQIQTEIFDSTHIWLSKGSISGWVRGIHNPSGGKNTFRAVASPELAYVIGVITGDGNLNIHGYNYEMLLSVTDFDFANEFSKCLAKVLGRPDPYRVRWSEKRKRWIVQGSSILLNRFLGRRWMELKPYVEHCDRCRGYFLRALFDGEGCISSRILSISNTDFPLLSYVRELLCTFGIETGNPHLCSPAGSILKDPRTGKLYKRRKNCYRIDIGAKGLPQFAKHIGFSIQRKKKRLPQTST